QFRIIFSLTKEFQVGMRFLGRAYPNPFSKEMEVPLLVEGDAEFWTMQVFNLTGQFVREISGEFTSGGLHTMTWDGKDRQGEDVAQGVYLYRLFNEKGAQGPVRRVIKQ